MTADIVIAAILNDRLDDVNLRLLEIFRPKI